MTPAGKGYERGEEEFSRVVNFSDGVFAIAMTLVVVSIEVPDVATDDLPRALGNLWPQIGAFFVSFIFIGRYWIAHHQFFGQLRSVDTRQIGYSLVYLAAIAFLPFPIAVVGRYENAPGRARDHGDDLRHRQLPRGGHVRPRPQYRGTQATHAG